MTQTSIRGLRTVIVLLIVHFLAACVSGPAVRDERLTPVNGERIARVLFIYQEARLSTRKTSGEGSAQISPYDTDLLGFGEALIGKAPESFRKFGATVIRASVVPPGEWRQFGPKAISELPPGTLESATLITVFPIGGSARTDHNASTIDLTFEVRVVDGRSGKMIWNAAIDTRTWKGRNIFNKNVPTTRFDPAYAEQFLTILLDKLRSNGLI